MLREPADAADAVQDTFLVATAKLRDLRDPAKLRSWLDPVARNECLRRRRAGSALSALDEAADIPAAAAERGAATERAEVQRLVRAAIDGLNPRERDVIELSLIQELTTTNSPTHSECPATTPTRSYRGRAASSSDLSAR